MLLVTRPRSGARSLPTQAQIRNAHVSPPTRILKKETFSFPPVFLHAQDTVCSPAVSRRRERRPSFWTGFWSQDLQTVTTRRRTCGQQRAQRKKATKRRAAPPDRGSC